MTTGRRAEVQALLRATARHLAAKERGDNSHLGRASVRPLDKRGDPMGEWKPLGPVNFSFTLTNVHPEVLDILTGGVNEAGT